MTLSNAKGAALITGASSGIGAVYADRLVCRSYNLFLSARDALRLETLAEKLCHIGIEVEAVSADLGSGAGRARVEPRLLRDASIAMLVNNAGTAIPGGRAPTDPDKAEVLIELNVIVATRLAGAAARAFSNRKSDTFINIASVIAPQPGRIGAVYSARKAYLLNLSQGSEVKLTPQGARVQAVLPANQTEIWGRAGMDVAQLPPEVVMGVKEMVDAAIGGFNQGEAVIILALPNIEDWRAFDSAWLAMSPKLSPTHAAGRSQTAAR